MKEKKGKSVQPERKTSRISIVRTSFSSDGIDNYPDSYSVIKGHPLLKDKFSIGDFETLTLFSKELAEYVKKIEEGGLV